MLNSISGLQEPASLLPCQYHCVQNQTQNLVSISIPTFQTYGYIDYSEKKWNREKFMMELCGAITLVEVQQFLQKRKQGNLNVMNMACLTF